MTKQNSELDEIDEIFAKYIARSVRVGGIHAQLEAKQAISALINKRIVEELQNYVFGADAGRIQTRIAELTKSNNEENI